MKVVALIPIALCVMAAVATASTPVARVITLLEGLKTRIETESAVEQKLYDKYACWCEKTFARKEQEIKDLKERIAELDSLALEKSGTEGTLGGTIDGLKADIARTQRAMDEATEIRGQQNEEFTAEVGDLHAALGALERAIDVLSKKTSKQSSLLGVVGNIESVMKFAAGRLTAQQQTVLGSFLAQPGHFGKSATFKQEYQPQSFEIQGILKTMLDTFKAELEKANSEEGQRNDAYKGLMKTKAEELGKLKEALTKREKDEADNDLALADHRQERIESKKALKEAIAFLAATRKACAAKADEWAERSRLRNEELTGIHQAVEILNGGLPTFQRSANTLLQLSQRSQFKEGIMRSAVKFLLRQAKQADSTRLTSVAMRTLTQTRGHFDEVIKMIDEMIVVLRAEAKDDAEHKAWCEVEADKLQNEHDAANYDKTKLNEHIKHTGEKKDRVGKAIAATGDEIISVTGEMAEAKTNRLSDRDNYETTRADDAKAVELLEGAIEKLLQFYKANKIEGVKSLLQKKEDPTGDPYLKENIEVDEDDRKFKTWESPYGGKKGESQGIVAIIRLIKRDIENEIKTADAAEIEARAAYDQGRDQGNAQIRSLEAQQADQKKEEGRLAGDIAGANKLIADKDAFIAANGESRAARDAACFRHAKFAERKTKRKTEIDALITAKEILAGAQGDDYGSVAAVA